MVVRSRMVCQVQAGREITAEDFEYLREMVKLFGGLRRDDLAKTICDHWGWVTPSGAYKRDACLKLLEKLEARGAFRLPAKRRYRRRKRGDLARRTVELDAGAPVVGKLSDVSPVAVEAVVGREDLELWNEYVGRYHYLGYKKPFGFFQRYFVASERGRLGCVLLSGAAKKIAVRDRWIGWSDLRRLNNLPWVVNNARFLIFPWVRVAHLAGHVLGQVARRVRDDWADRWGYRPVLLETFVDPARYRGVCYAAAGWKLLGETAGLGVRRPGREYRTTPKRMYARPLVRDFRELLCRENLVGRSAP